MTVVFWGSCPRLLYTGHPIQVIIAAKYAVKVAITMVWMWLPRTPFTTSQQMSSQWDDHSVSSQNEGVSQHASAASEPTHPNGLYKVSPWVWRNWLAIAISTAYNIEGN